MSNEVSMFELVESQNFMLKTCDVLDEICRKRCSLFETIRNEFGIFKLGYLPKVYLKPIFMVSSPN